MTCPAAPCYDSRMNGAGPLKINRAPVLTLWAAVVAERLGFDHDEALTLGRAVAGLNAYAKGQRLGIFQPSHQSLHDKRNQPAADQGFEVALLNRAVPVVMSPEGIRATAKGKPAKPPSVETYLRAKFGAHLPEITLAMAAVALSYPPEELADIAYRLYERFRPEIPRGVAGWGAAGVLDVAAILATARGGPDGR
jgi:hypothetical protein